MKKLILTLLCSVAFMTASAQIGYQVSLLNNATGEPRANENVSVTVKITDNKGNVICQETKSETTNDFGVVSMSVGNSDTFADADWSSLPFFIEASVDNHLIGRSQILSIPVAEHAKHTGILTKEILCSKTWECGYSSGFKVRFSDQNAYILYYDGDVKYKYEKYIIDGNFVLLVNGRYANGGTPDPMHNIMFYYDGARLHIICEEDF